jgi:hypothetical protein
MDIPKRGPDRGARFFEAKSRSSPPAALAGRTTRSFMDEAHTSSLRTPIQGTVTAFRSEGDHGVVGKSAQGNGVVGHSSDVPGGGHAGVFGEHLNRGIKVVGLEAAANNLDAVGCEVVNAVVSVREPTKPVFSNEKEAADE